MGKYQQALDNLAFAIKSYGANAYNKDLELLQTLINERQSTEVIARERAIEILEDTMLYGDFYYTMEDWLTECLCGNVTELPYGMESEYLKCALRVEVREYFTSYNAEYTDEEVELVVNRLLKDFNRSALNYEFIESVVGSYLVERINMSMEDLDV